MTIREHYRRAFKRMLVSMVIAPMVPVPFAIWLFPHARVEFYQLCAALLGVPIALVVGVRARRHFLCPRCGAPLHGVSIKGVFPPERNVHLRRWDKCPRCGVSFDAPYEPISG